MIRGPGWAGCGARFGSVAGATGTGGGRGNLPAGVGRRGTRWQRRQGDLAGGGLGPCDEGDSEGQREPRRLSGPQPRSLRPRDEHAGAPGLTLAASRVLADSPHRVQPSAEISRSRSPRGPIYRTISSSRPYGLSEFPSLRLQGESRWARIGIPAAGHPGIAWVTPWAHRLAWAFRPGGFSWPRSSPACGTPKAASWKHHFLHRCMMYRAVPSGAPVCNHPPDQGEGSSPRLDIPYRPPVYPRSMFREPTQGPRVLSDFQGRTNPPSGSGGRSRIPAPAAKRSPFSRRSGRGKD